MRTIATATMAVSTTENREDSTLSPAAQRSPWHSPVPYLFGGLAAMLGLIAFALLILACSYWRLTGQMEADRSSSEGQNRDIESGGGGAEKDDAGEFGDRSMKVYEEKILVIMAGDDNPTFLATPVCAKVSAFEDGNAKKIDNGEGEGKESNSDEKVKKEEAISDVHQQALNHDHADNDHQDSLQEQNQ